MNITISVVNKDLTPSHDITAQIPIAGFAPLPAFKGAVHDVALLGYRAAEPVADSDEHGPARQTIETFASSTHYNRTVANRFGRDPAPVCTPNSCLETSREDYVQLPFIEEKASMRFEAVFAKLSALCAKTIGADNGR